MATEQKTEQKKDVPRTLKEFLQFLWTRISQSKKWWLLPFYLVLIALAIALVLSGNGALLPAIYVAL